MSDVVIRAFGPFSKGHIFRDLPGGRRRMLLDRGFIARAVDQKEVDAVDAAIGAAFQDLETPASPQRSPADRQMRRMVRK